MNMFKRVGNDYVLEYSALNALRQGITSGITVTVSIRKDVLYWDDTPDTFSSVTEVQLVLTHVINGLYRFTSVGGAVFGIQTYEIHLTVTGNPDVNESSTFTETIEGGLSSYPEGGIYFDSSATSNTGTVLGIDGVSTKKSTDEAASVTLATALGTRKILVQGSFDNVVADGFLIEGINNQDASVDPSLSAITNSTFRNLEIESGTFGNLGNVTFDNCLMPLAYQTTAANTQFLKECYITGTLQSAGQVEMTNCSSAQNNDQLILDFVSDMYVYATGYKGNLKIVNMTGFTGARIHMMGGQLEIDSSNTEGDIQLTGWGHLIDTSGVGITVNVGRGFKDLGLSPIEVYPEGAIYFDSAATANTNTVLGYDGISTNRVTGETAASVLAAAIGTKHILVQGSFDNVALDGFLIEGLNIDNASYAPSATAVTDTTFKNMEIEAGTFGIVGVTFDRCNLPVGISASGQANQFFRNCCIGGTVKVLGHVTTAKITMTDCYTDQNSDAMILDCEDDMFPNITGHKGNIKIINMVGGTVTKIHMMGGEIEVDSSNDFGTLILTGWGKLIDNKTGLMTINLSKGWQEIPAGGGGGDVTLEDNAANTTFIENTVWDALRSDHMATGSFGEFVLSNVVQWAGSGNVDGVSLSKYAKILLSYSTGKFKIDFPNPGDITFFEQDNSTEIFTMNVTSIDRTRV